MRLLLFMSGLALAGYGTVLVSENPPLIITRIVVWALVAVALHDVVFAPLCAAMGLSSRRVLPAVWQAPVAVAALCTVALVLLAIPVFDKPGASLDNGTVLDRDYHAGLWISLAVVWACVPGYLVGRRLLPVRHNQVVESKSADDVCDQPPAS
ncbi:hypothetical protein D2E41_26725 [Mycobacteroides abscessus]|uniref:hypothetical protein n=1 Tax=Mycobacteriaceae TaxID=1762 RepID=UPI0008DCDA43|nr:MULTISPECIES: hypothetical protein [Mycobacteriaceae]RIR16511.1 hypothetical protein D2E41_26725 [Mycobacteroides abscessus]